MNINSVKIKIAVTIAVLLIVAMLLIDIVMVITNQRNYVRSQALIGYTLTDIIEKKISSVYDQQEVHHTSEILGWIDGLMNGFGFSSIYLMDANKKNVHVLCDDRELEDALKKITGQVILSGKKKEMIIGNTWGVLGNQGKYLVVASPLYSGQRAVGGVSLAHGLENFNGTAQKTQTLVLIYVLINTMILAALGTYRITGYTLKPIVRLIKRTKEYRDEDDFGFFHDHEKNEIGLLSTSLNQMIGRISNDRKKLQSSLQSLEKANLELKNAQKEIIQAEKLASVGRLSAGIAHEIGNPIGIVLGYLELLKKRDSQQDEREDYISRAESEVVRINGIIKQLLNFSRPSKEGFTKVSVNQVIEETKTILGVQPLMSKIEIKTIYSSEDDTVFADPNQLRQIFLNLMINASDAIRAGENRDNGEITIKTYKEMAAGNPQPLLKIVFTDNGIGMPQNMLNDIFDPFFTTKEPGKGTGLGLSVSFMIVKEMRGTITAESFPGKGTSITVSLPVERRR